MSGKTRWSALDVAFAVAFAFLALSPLIGLAILVLTHGS